MGKKHFFPTFFFFVFVMLVCIPSQTAFSWTKGCNCPCKCRVTCYVHCFYKHTESNLQSKKSYYHTDRIEYQFSVDGEKSCFFKCGDCYADSFDDAKNLCKRRFEKGVCEQWVREFSCPKYEGFTSTKEYGSWQTVKSCGYSSYR